MWCVVVVLWLCCGVLWCVVVVLCCGVLCCGCGVVFFYHSSTPLAYIDIR